MKTKIESFLLTTILGLFISIGVSSQTTPQAQEEKTGKVEMYYFHFNTRCETCRAVESEAQLGIQLLFGDKVKFIAVNLDEKEGELIGEKIGVNSQSLVVVKGDKKINLTNQGFLYARTNPDKFREIIEEKIKPLL